MGEGREGEGMKNLKVDGSLDQKSIRLDRGDLQMNSGVLGKMKCLFILVIGDSLLRAIILHR